MSSKAELEAKIVELAKTAWPDRETQCFDEQNLYDYLESWYLLSKYFETTEDENYSIAVEVVREYMDSLNLFYGVWKQGKASEECRERAEEALQELEHHMRAIIAAVEIRLYPYGR